MPDVIVTFYDNFRTVDKSIATVANIGPLTFDPGEERYYRLITFVVLAKEGTWQAAIFNDGDIIAPEFERYTSNLAWDADAATIAAALEAVGEIGSFNWEFDPVANIKGEDDELKRVVKNWAADVDLLPAGYNTKSENLHGHTAQEWDEHPHKVPLEEAELAESKKKESEIEPTDASSSPKKTRNRKSNQRLSTANVQGGDGTDPFPDSPNDSSPT